MRWEAIYSTVSHQIAIKLPLNCHQIAIKLMGSARPALPPSWRCSCRCCCAAAFARAHTHTYTYTRSMRRGTPKKRREAANERMIRWLTTSLLCFLFQVSLSMIFQASRFSASGRRVPLEPRRSEACRSCQPMHVLSFGEGRSFVFWVPVRVRQPAFGKCEQASWWSLDKHKSCDHMFYFAPSRETKSPIS